MNIEQLYLDYNIFFLTEGHKHTSPNWVHTECPFCTGNPGYHLGYSLISENYTCWRCGWHPVSLTLSKLMRLPEYEVIKIIKEYGITLKSDKREIIPLIKTKHKFPSNVIPLSLRHKVYLAKRKFDPEYLERTWKLMGTGPVSNLDNISYKHRILIPFIWEGNQVSFDSRDITGKHQNKYQACPKAREYIEHKSILYGNQEAWKETGIIVEGPTDVWRLGETAAATSGIKVTTAQIRVISKSFKKVIVIFDNEIEAQKQAKNLVKQLKFRGVKAKNLTVDSDPGSMKEDDAKYLIKNLVK